MSCRHWLFWSNPFHTQWILAVQAPWSTICANWLLLVTFIVLLSALQTSCPTFILAPPLRPGMSRHTSPWPWELFASSHLYDGMNDAQRLTKNKSKGAIYLRLSVCSPQPYLCESHLIIDQLDYFHGNYISTLVCISWPEEVNEGNNGRYNEFFGIARKIYTARHWLPYSSGKVPSNMRISSFILTD